jgi:hypothetical protein
MVEFVNVLVKYLEGDLRSALEVCYRRVWPGVCLTRWDAEDDRYSIASPLEHRLGSLGYLMYLSDRLSCVDNTLNNHSSYEGEGAVNLRFIFSHHIFDVSDAEARLHHNNHNNNNNTTTTTSCFSCFTEKTTYFKPVDILLAHDLVTLTNRQTPEYLTQCIVNILKFGHLSNHPPHKQDPPASGTNVFLGWRSDAAEKRIPRPGDGCGMNCCLVISPPPPPPPVMPPPSFTPALTDVNAWSKILEDYDSLPFAKQLLQTKYDRFDSALAPLARHISAAQTTRNVDKTLSKHLFTILIPPLIRIVTQFAS